jgi:hypothetical protein
VDNTQGLNQQGDEHIDQHNVLGGDEVACVLDAEVNMNMVMLLVGLR